jgi:flavorubredoxin
MMKAVVVYESHWGNTAAIARAIADGIGPDTRVLTTNEASGPEIADVDLLVAGAPVLGFGLPSERMQEAVAATVGEAPAAPDVSHPSLRSWLAALPPGRGRAAAFETRVRWSPGGATGAIERGLERAGYRAVAESGKFIVKGRYGPLRDGEFERARRWGTELRQG